MAAPRKSSVTGGVGQFDPKPGVPEAKPEPELDVLAELFSIYYGVSFRAEKDGKLTSKPFYFNDPSHMRGGRAGPLSQQIVDIDNRSNYFNGPTGLTLDLSNYGRSYKERKLDADESKSAGMEAKPNVKSLGSNPGVIVLTIANPKVTLEAFTLLQKELTSDTPFWKHPQYIERDPFLDGREGKEIAARIKDVLSKPRLSEEPDATAAKSRDDDKTASSGPEIP